MARGFLLNINQNAIVPNHLEMANSHLFGRDFSRDVFPSKDLSEAVFTFLKWR